MGNLWFSSRFQRDLEGYFGSLAPQGFQNPIFPFWHKDMGISPPKGALAFQVVSQSVCGLVCIGKDEQ